MSIYNGTEGPDIYVGGSDDDTINGNGGADLLAGGGGADTIDGGAGDDTIFSSNPSPVWGNSYFYIDPVIPVLDTGSEVDTIRGGAGFDTIFAGYGDNVDGGTDRARLLISFQGATSGVSVNFQQLANGGSLVVGGGTITNVTQVAWVDGSNFDDVISMGYPLDNNGNTDIRGLGGNDTLVLGSYRGNLYGGEGNDTLDARNGGSGYLYGEAGNDTIYMGNVFNIGFAATATTYSMVPVA